MDRHGNDWNACCNTSEALIEQTAQQMVATGLRTAGYDYVNVDDCWQTKSPDAAVIAVDQDPLGRQGTVLSATDGEFVLAKPLSNGDVAVTLFNSTGTATTIATTATAAGPHRDAAYQLDDVWTGQHTETTGTIGAFVPAHGTVMYRVSAPRNPATILGETPSTILSVSDQDSQLNVGATETITVSLTDNGVLPVAYGAPTLTVPPAWRVHHSDRPSPAGLLGTNRTTSAIFTVTAPPSGPPLSTADLTGAARIFGFATDTATLGLRLVSPLRAPYLTADTTGSAAVFGQSGNDFAISAAGTGVAPATTRAPDTASASTAAQPYPIQLKLIRAGTTYTGYYSTDGTTWVPVGTATVAAANANQDVAMFHTAGANSPSEADFTGLTVS